MRWLIQILAVLSFSTLLNANVINVPGDYPTIQKGIDNTVDGDTVLVADGIYTGIENRNLDFRGKKITVMSKNGADFTTINCKYSDRGFYFHSGENS